MSALSLEDRTKFNSGLEHILDIVGDTIPEPIIKDALVAHNFDAEKSLEVLLNQPQSQKTMTSGSSLPPIKPMKVSD